MSVERPEDTLPRTPADVIEGQRYSVANPIWLSLITGGLDKYICQLNQTFSIWKI